MSWNGSDSNKAEDQRSDVKQRKNKIPSTPTPKTYTYKRGALAGLIVVALGGAALCWFFGGGRGATRPPTEVGSRVPRDRAITEVAPSLATNGASPRIVASAPATNDAPDKSGWRMIGNKRGKMLSCTTNAAGAVISMWELENGKKMKNVAPPNLFDNPADQVLAMLLGAEEGADLPPIPDLGELDVDFFKATLKPIEIAEDDPPDVKRIKERVRQGREDMLALMKEGKSFADIARDHHELVTGNIAIRDECIREMRKFADEGDVEGAVKYREKVNATLKGMGIDEINMPLTDEEKEESERDYENEEDDEIE